MSDTSKGKYWPYGIVIGMLSFICFIGYIVFRVSSADVHLVRKDYYQQEIEYENKIQSIRRSGKDVVAIQYLAESEIIKIVINDKNNDSSKVIGIVMFYRPSDANLDFKVPLKLINGVQQLNTSKLKSGPWRIKLDFEISNDSYYKELLFNK